MKLDKAIKIKEVYYQGGEIPNHADYRMADILAIEAMKAIQEYRQYVCDPEQMILPGEAED